MSQTAPCVLPDGLEPAWDIARLFPPQGGWSEDEYLKLPGNTLAEFDHGRIEVLDMPSEWHQLLVAYLYRALVEYVGASALGTVLFAPFPVKLWEARSASRILSSCAASMRIAAIDSSGKARIW